MKYEIIGTDCFAQALARAGEAAGFAPSDSQKNAQIIFVCGDAQQVETQALQALELDGEIAVPGWITADFERFGRLHQRFAQHGKKLILLFPDRYTPHVRDVQRVQQANRLGRIGMVDFLNQWPQACSPLLPLAEALDTTLLWLGEPAAVRGFQTGREDTSCATLSATFANGALLNLAAVASPCESWHTRYEWSGSSGNLAYDSQEARSVRLPQEEEAKSRFPMLGTRACPLRAMLLDLPGLIQAHCPGACQQDWKLANLIREAFGKEDGTNAQG